uniref:Uncharacterized protein n=1 Tax=Spongospora subterranea TaxID=70186 RepID=A0A0H5RSV7_9EUKA|eukprot:CRZ11799.1 hypothetical protein [Spongospora subterranea]
MTKATVVKSAMIQIYPRCERVWDSICYECILLTTFLAGDSKIALEPIFLRTSFLCPLQTTRTWEEISGPDSRISAVIGILIIRYKSQFPREMLDQGRSVQDY